MLVTVLLLCFSQSVSAQDVAGLAYCTTKLFREIGRSGKWTGKAPAGCSARVALEKRASGYFVTAWVVEDADGGWIRTAFSGAMGSAEILSKKSLARASREIMTRAGQLERCLKSINSVNDPLGCRDHATRSHIVGNESGTETKRLVWLDDGGRHTVVEYAFGSTRPSSGPPVDLFDGEPLPEGLLLNLHLLDER
jgi:hypothetical protein